MRQTTALERFERLWLAKAFLREFVLFYPVYALYMADRGVTPAAYGALLAAWALTVLLAEVPSGVLADRFSRRALLMVGGGLRGAGFLLWWLLPDVTGFALGFVLWGLGSAAESGANEALLYETLVELDAAEQLERILGRGEASGGIAVLLALGAGGFVAQHGIGWVAGASAAAAIAHTGIVYAGLREPVRASASRSSRLIAVRGLAGVAGSLALRRALLACVLVTAYFGALDEFFAPLLGDLLAQDLRVVGTALAGLYLCRAIGLAGAHRVRSRLGIWMAALWGVIALLVGTLIGGAAATLAGLAVFAFAFGVAEVLTSAALQRAITGDSRATLTSLAGLGQELLSLVAFVFVGALAQATDWRTSFVALACGGLALIVSAAVYRARW
ncbi:MAG: MFS transporter [Pseudomonadota bacterium]